MTSPAEASSTPQRADLTAWLAVGAGTIGALMATLDISIVNASLPQIQGEVGASESEGTWISTAYLVAEIIMIPLAGWFERLLTLRIFLLVVTVGFVLSSMLCGTSTTLVSMIIGRIGQGFAGGAMIPTALTIVAKRLPPEQRPVGIALFGLTAVLGPVLGPIIGGWLTENVSWHYAFFLNLPVGIGLVGLLLLGLPSERTHWREVAQADWLGIIGMAIGLGCLTVVLEEGQRERWFESNFIILLSLASLLGFGLLAAGQSVSRKPVIDLRIIFQRSFGGVFLMSLVVGGALYGILYLIPQFLSKIAGYNAEQAGYVALLSGIPTLLMMPLFPFLVRRLDVRVAIGFGLFLYGISCLLNAGLSPESSGIDFLFAQILRGFAQFFTLVFLNQAATSSVSHDKVEDASGLFNAARNLGGSMALAMISTLQERRTTLHVDRISETLSGNSVRVQELIAGFGARVEDVQRGMQALGQAIRLQATVITFSDQFFVLGVILLLTIPLVVLLRPLPKDAGVSVG